MKFIEFELKGSRMMHTGIFELTGFWARFGTDVCDITQETENYKIWSHSSFSFEHVEIDKARLVWYELRQCVRSPRGYDAVMPGIGYISVSI